MWACISVNFKALDVAVHDQVSPENMQSLQYKLKFAATWLGFSFDFVLTYIKELFHWFGQV